MIKYSHDHDGPLRSALHKLKKASFEFFKKKLPVKIYVLQIF